MRKYRGAPGSGDTDLYAESIRRISKQVFPHEHRPGPPGTLWADWTKTMENMHIQNGILISYTGREETLALPEGVHTIGEGALKGCASLKKVLLPRSLRRILGGAFKGCRKLEEVEIPAGVWEIGAYAFHRCHSLRRIALPPGVVELGDCAFLYCDSLEEARIPGVRRLGSQAFVNDVQLKKLTLSHALEEECLCDVFTGCGLLTDFTFTDGRHFVIPNAVEAVAGEEALPSLVRGIAADILRMMKMDGRTVTEFLTNLKHVEIPEGVEKIGKSAFFDKRGILSVKLPGSLKEIESRAFRNCISLETVLFEGEGMLIHEDAFKNCTSLKYIYTPDGIRHELTGIGQTSGPEAPALVRTVHRQVLGNFRISGTVLLRYLGAESRVVVPEGITVIAEEAFAGNETINRVILPQSLRQIGQGAFRDCLLLQTVVFPQNLERIGREAFENCVKLLRAALPEAMTRLEKGVFKYCRALKETDLGGNLERIEEQAFFRCDRLERISFPERLVYIGELAFYRCRALKKVRLSAKVTQVESMAFAGSGVEEVRIGAACREYGGSIFADCDRLGKLTLEEGVRHVPDKLAWGCAALEQVMVPGSLESAGVTPWENTPFLEKWIQEGRQGDIFWDGGKASGQVRLPENVRILAGGAFYGNRNITEVHLPESVKWVGPRAFDACCSLRRVYWHSPADRLEEAVFAGCRLLVSVEDAQGRPVAWKSLGESVFYNCRSLQRICLRQAESIGSTALYGCVELKWEESQAPLPGILRYIGERAFEDTLPDEQEGRGLKVFGNILVSGAGCEGELVVPEGITGIAPFAFSENNSITGIVLPRSLTWIGEGAFWACRGLREISFPENLCEVGARAFEKCSSLPEIRLAAGRLGTAAFAYCASLEKAVLSGGSVLPGRLFEGCASLRVCICDHAARIQEHCFSGCVSLGSFDFLHIEEIGEYAFEGCDHLRKIELAAGVLIRPHAFEDCGRLEEIRLGQGTFSREAGCPGQGAFSREAGCPGGRVCPEAGCPDRDRSFPDLGEYAFSGCTSLRWVQFQNRRWAFDSYEDLLSDQIPQTARLIFHSAMSCFAVEGESILCGYRGAGRIVRIPRGIRRIAAEVFRDVMMLEEIIIPDSVDYIGPRAFHGTAWMDRQRRISPFVTVNHMLLDASCCVGEVVVPPDIRMVCGWAFANGMGIEKIRFLSAQTKVEEHAFRNCIYLRDIILPDNTSVHITGIADRERPLPALAAQAVMDSMNCFKTDKSNVLVECTGNIAGLRMPEGITAIGEGVFQDGNLLTTVTFPRSLVSVGNRAFSGCKWLKEIRQAQNVEEIGDRAFFNCGSLERVEGLEKLRRLGARAFENCTSLEEIVIPEGVEEIPERAFYRCHSLKQIRLPVGIKRIGREAFAFCRELSQIRMPRNAADHIIIEERAFVGCADAPRLQQCKGIFPFYAEQEGPIR